jgi:hypothetical protein
MRVKVSLMGDVCLPRPASLTIHDGPCFEMPTPMMWPPGLALQQNKLTTTVFHKAQFIALREHDCGHMIPHVTVPATNPELPLIIAFSKRKVMFSSSKVKANGAQIACTEIGSPPVPLPMLCCGSPLPCPTGFPSFNGLHTVSVGVSIGDIVAGFIAIAMGIVGELLCARFGLTKGGLAGLASKLLGASTVQEWAFKQALGLISGCARIALTQEGKLKVEVGSGYAGFEATIEHEREGRLKLGAEAHAADLKTGCAYANNPNGTTSHQFTGSQATLEGTYSTQYTTTSGRTGEPAEKKLQITNTRGSVSTYRDGPSDASAALWQQTTTLQANGHATSTTATYAGSSSAAGTWGTPL